MRSMMSLISLNLSLGKTKVSYVSSGSFFSCSHLPCDTPWHPQLLLKESNEVVFCSKCGPGGVYTGYADTKIKNFGALIWVLKSARSKQLFLGWVSLIYTEVLKRTDGKKATKNESTFAEHIYFHNLDSCR